ncbi:phage/plasmid primase-like uncharacterized protein [Rhizobium sp. PP-WC-1G-195]|nr:phage/plasmid primase-like uncharacterized protein [Rhizobium sp. PP-WC-1G-195]
MASAGVHLDRGSARGPHPIADGKLHRADATGKKVKKNSHVWYVLHADGVAAGAFGDYAAGIEDTWCAKKPSSMTDEERRALKDRMKETQRLRAEELAEMQAAAREAAAVIMKATGKASLDHAYLSRKGLPVFAGLRVIKENVRYSLPGDEKPRVAYAGNLVVPMFTPQGELVGIQMIHPDGKKLFLKGTAKDGNYHSIGKAPVEPDGIILIAEGYATAARVHAATGYLTIAAFDSGNLLSVAKAIRSKYPVARIVFAADNDRMTVRPIENPGVHFAEAAAAAVSGRVSVPVFEDGDITSTDFDDLAQIAGIEKVRETIEATINPKADIVDPGKTSSRRLLSPEDFVLDELPRRPTILVVKGKIHIAVDEAIGVLSHPDLGVFARGEILVKAAIIENKGRTISLAKASENVVRPDGAVVVRTLSEPGLCEILTRHASFAKPSKTDDGFRDAPIDCPPEVARMVLARRGDGWTIPQLRAVIQAPCLRHDGTVVEERGYDVQTGLLLVGDRLWRKVPDTPSKRDALDALDVLTEPLSHFPFVDNCDRAASVALLLTAVIRPILKTSPMFVVSAPAAGSGKSKMVDIAAVLATGRPAAVIAPAVDEVEMEKRLALQLRF